MIKNGHLSTWIGRRRIDTPTPADREFGRQIPDPAGWFGLAYADQIKPGCVHTSRLMNEDVVLYRTGKGVLRAVRPYCPHLGVHLGLGRVRGDNLTCAFHEFEYGPDGSCVKAYETARPPKLSLTPLRIREEPSGLVLAWYHPDGAEPAYEIPDVPTAGFTPWAHATIETIGHPQELMENPIDFGHFPTYHQMPGIMDASTDFQGATYLARLLVKPLATLELKLGPLHARLPRRIANLTFRVTIDTHGLGLALAEFALPSGRPIVRVSAMPSVQTGGHMIVRLGAALAVHHRWIPPLRGLQRRLQHLGSGLALRLILDFSFNERRTGSDVPIWATKRFVAHPQTVVGDGPIAEYRRWAKQFCPDPRPEPADRGRRPAGAAAGPPVPDDLRLLGDLAEN